MERNDRLRCATESMQLYGVQRLRWEDGKAAGLGCCMVESGAGLMYAALPDRALDIAWLKYRGQNISFLPKGGMGGAFHPFESDFLNTFPGGMLYTCGLTNAGDAHRDGETWQPMHGRLHSIPARSVSARTDEEAQEIVLQGVVDEGALFGHRLELSRRISTPIGKNEIMIEDVLANLTPEPTPFMITYHMNFGYPFLSENLRIVRPEGCASAAMDRWSAPHLDDCFRFTMPIDGALETGFYHDIPAHCGVCAIEAENPELGIRARLEYGRDTLPVLVEWKSMGSGDYVLGLEPSNNYVMGRAREREHGTLQTIEPFGKRRFFVRLLFEDM